MSHQNKRPTVLETIANDQNLIQELVIINQLLVEALDILRAEANKVPQLENSIQQLQLELRKLYQVVQEQRIEKARLEATRVPASHFHLQYQTAKRAEASLSEDLKLEAPRAALKPG